MYLTIILTLSVVKHACVRAKRHISVNNALRSTDRSIRCWNHQKTYSSYNCSLMPLGFVHTLGHFVHCPGKTMPCTSTKKVCYNGIGQADRCIRSNAKFFIEQLCEVHCPPALQKQGKPQGCSYFSDLSSSTSFKWRLICVP